MTTRFLIAGLQYIRNYLDQTTHDRLIAVVDEHVWQQSVDHRVQVYGYHYSRRQQDAYRIGELPPWGRALAVQLADDGYVPQVPNQLVVNDYPPGAGIFQHIDQDVFGDTVISISLGSTCVMRFTETTAGHTEDVLLEPRSLLVLSGAARWRWQHEIPARGSDMWDGREYPRSRRVSLTFRRVPEPDA